MNKLSVIVTEDQAVPFGYGFVRNRFDYYGEEVAIMPLNWLIRFIYYLQRKSYVIPSEKELKAMKHVRELQVEANRLGYERGYEDGKKAGEQYLASLLGESLRAGVLPVEHKEVS